MVRKILQESKGCFQIGLRVSAIKTKTHYEKAISLFKQSAKDDPKNAGWFNARVSELEKEMRSKE